MRQESFPIVMNVSKQYERFWLAWNVSQIYKGQFSVRQGGGGSMLTPGQGRGHLRNGIPYRVAGHVMIIRFLPGDYGDETSYGIIGGNNPSAPCFWLRINTKDRIGFLQSVLGSTQCFLGEAPEYKNTTAVVRAAYQFAVEHGITTLIVDDDSRLHCPQTVVLSDLSFLTTGRTWYERIIPGCQPTDEEMRAQIDEWRERVRKSRWVDVKDVLGDEMLFDTSGIDVDAAGSTMAVLARAKKHNNRAQSCSLLAAYVPLLMMRLGIGSLWGKSWTCNIAGQRRLTRRASRRTRTTRKRNNVGYSNFVKSVLDNKLFTVTRAGTRS